MTVGDVLDQLQQFDRSTPVVVRVDDIEGGIFVGSYGMPLSAIRTKAALVRSSMCYEFVQEPVKNRTAIDVVLLG